MLGFFELTAAANCPLGSGLSLFLGGVLTAGYTPHLPMDSDAEAT